MKRNENGQALTVTVVGLSLVIAVLLTALTITDFSGKIVGRQLTYQGQAMNAAQAGLTEGLSWFRRQSTQPVTAFVPVRDAGPTPLVNDTDDAAVGLVRHYEISQPGRVWGRYELRKTPATFVNKNIWSASTPYVIDDVVMLITATGQSGVNGSYYRAKTTTTGNNPASSPTRWELVNTMDISKQRGKSDKGIAWQMESEGIVYVRNSAAAYNVAPNKVLSRTKLRTEIQRIGLVLPSQGALSVARGNGVTFGNNNYRIRASTNGAINWLNNSTATPTGSYVPPTSIQIVGTVGGTIPTAPSRFTIPYIFGVPLAELLVLADLTEDKVADLPAEFPKNSMVILRDTTNLAKTYTFDAARPLTGTGVLVVFGDLVIAANSSSAFSGVIYVEGSYTQRAPSSITGALIVNNTGARTVNIQGAGQLSEIRYDANVIRFIQARMGLYRLARSPYAP